VQSLNAPSVRLSLLEGSLADRISALLLSLPNDTNEYCFPLEDLSLQLGTPLPDLAQNATFWQRGDVGRVVRGQGFAVQVRYREVVFVCEGRDRGA
jgi:hypothetical protein